MENNFQKDLTNLFNNGIFDTKTEIKFYCRYGSRIKGNIENLELGTRSSNALHRYGFTTVEQVSDAWDDLNKIRCLGVKTIAEIHEKLIEFYYSTLTEEEKSEFWVDTVKATMS